MTDATELRSAIGDLTTEVRELRRELVRQDVYASDMRGVDARFQRVTEDVDAIEVRLDKDADARRQDRRLALYSFLVPVVLLVLNLYLTSRVGPS